MARPPKFDDDELLDRAMALFWERGWAQTSIRDLEAALHVKAPSIYRRFGSKEGLEVAVLDHYVERIVRPRIARYLSGDGDPIENLTVFLERSVRAGDDGRLWGCLVTMSALDPDGPDAAIDAARRRGRDVIAAGLRSEVARAADAGRLAERVDVDDAAATLALVMQGLMSLARGGASSAELRRGARAALAMIAAP